MATGDLDEYVAIALFLKYAPEETASRYANMQILAPAKLAADIIWQHKQRILNSLAEAGIIVEQRPGHILPQSHVARRIACAAGGINFFRYHSPEDKAAWVAEMLDTIEMDKTLDNIECLRNDPEAKEMLAGVKTDDVSPSEFVSNLWDILTLECINTEPIKAPGDHGTQFLKARNIRTSTFLEPFIDCSFSFGLQEFLSLGTL